MKEIVWHVLGTPKLYNFPTVEHSRVQSPQGHDVDWGVDWRTKALEVPTLGFEFQLSFLHMWASYAPGSSESLYPYL